MALDEHIIITVCKFDNRSVCSFATRIKQRDVHFAGTVCQSLTVGLYTSSSRGRKVYTRDLFQTEQNIR